MYSLNYRDGLLYASVKLTSGGKSIIVENVINVNLCLIKKISLTKDKLLFTIKPGILKRNSDKI